MECPIEPADWDVIVVGSALPQCLLASALAKAGRSVLLIDPEDTYGSEAASFTLEALRQAALGAQDVSLTAEPVSSTAAMTQQQPCRDGHASDKPLALEPGTVLVPLQRFKLPLHGVVGFVQPEEAGHREAPGSYVLDLLPKMLYQAEPLVELLVKCRAHHYLEFKRVEGSYIVTQAATAPQAASKGTSHSATPTASATAGASAAACPSPYTLRPVPASKSDIFKDRTLSLSDKRSLMGFLAAAVEAVQGGGRLKNVLVGNTPLVDVLAAEGVPPALREIVLHGIAMHDVAQEGAPAARTPSLRQQPAPEASASTAATDSQTAAAFPDAESFPSASSSCATAASEVRELLSAQQGIAALQLFMESTARFGGPGAFMVPSWGCGSVPEAFVRCCAVAGGSTVLRCRGAAVTLAKGTGAAAAVQRDKPALVDGVAAVEADKQGRQQQEGQEQQGRPERQGQQQQQQQQQGAGAELEGQQAEGAYEASSDADAGSGTSRSPCKGAWRVTGLVTDTGQVLRCQHLVAGAEAMRALAKTLSSTQPAPCTASTSTSFAPSSPAAGTLAQHMLGAAGASALSPTLLPEAPSEQLSVAVHRALVIMDRSLVSGQANLTLVVPPRSAVLGGANAHPVRALQLGPTLGVCPSGRYLLYLSTVAPAARSSTEGVEMLGDGSTAGHYPAASLAALQALQAAVEMLVQTAGLQPLAPTAAAAAPVAAGTAETGKAEGSAVDSANYDADGATKASDARPKALQAFYYTQRQVQGPPQPALPPNACCTSTPCTASDLGLVGHISWVTAAEAAFRLHFPDLPWLSELDPDAGAGGADDEDADAIDELQAALGNLGPAAAAS